MRLFYSPNSPYGRYVRIVLYCHNLETRVEEVKLHPFDNPPELIGCNPLGKVPALQLDCGRSVLDSDVIAQYFDQELGDGRLSAGPEIDWDALVYRSMVKGLIDCAVLLRGENWRAEREGECASDLLSARHRAAIERTLSYFEQRLELSTPARPTLANILLTVALAYIDFRHPETRLNERYASLVGWVSNLKGDAFHKSAPEVK